MPELTEEQAASFRPITQEEHLRFKKMLAGGKRTGRPTKPLDEKEHVHGIRFSDQLLNKIKAKADVVGLGWQTYVKKILAAEVEKT